MATGCDNVGTPIAPVSAPAGQSIRTALLEALPPAGRKAQGKLALWALGNQASNEEFEEVLSDDRVQWELQQTPVDGTGLSDAVRGVYCDSGHRIRDAMLQPMEKLMFLMLFK